jgi:hypothetical protein
MRKTQINKIRDTWNTAFKDLKEFKVSRDSNEFYDDDEVRRRFNPRQLAGLYAVASICYGEGNDENVIEDIVFDRLCKWLFKNYDECIKAGADLLDKKELGCCSGNDTTKFVKHYHDIAELFLEHECHCVKCKREQNPNLN